MVAIFAVLLSLWLIGKAAGVTLRSQSRARVGGEGGGVSGLVLLLGVLTAVVWVVAAVTGHAW
ncbi:hypothetical protein EDD29_6415 [Actinocorallia herbida]|uniref:Uncharacterized protein n=1 Tax=Actinocorallia herbida TaxID=58109 RepID=A0A3N1D5K3_9ACTN|nr:hypothetical protein [Actinocorallia herbida]ROO88736.1 hypothetical protein EDD29_6415 [Actinocorallia herbida]